MKRWIGILIIGILFVTGCNKAPAIPNEPVATVAPSPTKMPEVTATPVSTQTPKPTATSGPEKEPSAGPSRIIAIDPGHQGKGNYDKEPVGPGATEKKAKVSSGTQGRTTKVPEHQFNLELSLKLRDALTEEGYMVVMTRETAEVDISNAERAQLANEARADIFIRIHADGSDNTAANGISVLYPSERNPYVANLSADSERLAQSVLDGMCTASGAKSRGIIERDDLTGTNWAQMPVIVVEAGFMTNEAEEKKLINAEYQKLLVQGLLEGIRDYFKD
ncbi:MAG: N-acetylmuramoyl-L-alanine amidase [Lachnospiraceae bacterium]|nr:N-acetylmuramoyl-L-alanine amidase [Lachnospiraceae bacterium]